MNRLRTIMISAAAGMALTAGIAFAQQNDIFVAQGSIDEAIMSLQRAAQAQRYADPLAERGRTRALAYLMLAKTELQSVGSVRPLN